MHWLYFHFSPQLSCFVAGFKTPGSLQAYVVASYGPKANQIVDVKNHRSQPSSLAFSPSCGKEESACSRKTPVNLLKNLHVLFSEEKFKYTVL